MAVTCSAFLNELLAYAAKEEPRLASGAVIAPHFFMTALRFAVDPDAFPWSVENASLEYISERSAFREALSDLTPGAESLIDELCQSIAAEGEKSAIEVFVFRQALDRAALESEDKTVTAPALLKVLLRDAPPAIKRYLDALVTAEVAASVTPPTDTTSTDTTSTDTTSTDTTSTDTTPSEKPVPEGDVAKAIAALLASQK